MDLKCTMTVNLDTLIDCILLDEIVHEKVEEKLEKAYFCYLAIERTVNDIFNDLYNEGVEERVILQGQMED